MIHTKVQIINNSNKSCQEWFKHADSKFNLIKKNLFSYLDDTGSKAINLPI